MLGQVDVDAAVAISDVEVSLQSVDCMTRKCFEKFWGKSTEGGRGGGFSFLLLLLTERMPKRKRGTRDFEKRKKKVGRKAPVAENATNTNVRNNEQDDTNAETKCGG